MASNARPKSIQNSGWRMLSRNAASATAPPLGHAKSKAAMAKMKKSMVTCNCNAAPYTLPTMSRVLGSGKRRRKPASMDAISTPPPNRPMAGHDALRRSAASSSGVKKSNANHGSAASAWRRTSTVPTRIVEGENIMSSIVGVVGSLAFTAEGTDSCYVPPRRLVRSGSSAAFPSAACRGASENSCGREPSRDRTSPGPAES